MQKCLEDISRFRFCSKYWNPQILLRRFIQFNISG